MDPLQGIILGVIQGLTEFLPVSSSGHLVLARHLFGTSAPDLFFDTSVHVGTMLAVILVFRRTIGEILRALLVVARSRMGNNPPPLTAEDARGVRFAFLVVLGSIPTAIIGLAIESLLAEYLASLYLVGGMLLATALLLALTRGRGKTGKGVERFSTAGALVVGGAQGLAVLPGMSRSGATIAVGLLLGLNRKEAAGFSFLLSIPAIIGAQLLSWKNLADGAVTLAPAVWLGSLTAFGVGYLALKVLLKLVHQGRFYLFAPYCLIVGLLVLGIAGG